MKMNHRVTENTEKGDTEKRKNQLIPGSSISLEANPVSCLCVSYLCVLCDSVVRLLLTP
jgi:hypothetical protein